jgi:hypothetical protein
MVMEQDKEKQRRNNLRVGWSIGILVVILYVASMYFGMGG